MTETNETIDATRREVLDELTGESQRNGNHFPPTDAIRSNPPHGRSGTEAQIGMPAVSPPDVRRNDAEESGKQRENTELDAAWGERFRGSGNESLTHVWGKLALAQRRHAQRNPWFRGTYEFERTVSDWVADCLITDPAPCAWLEFVVSAAQRYRAKTRAALRFGYPIYWVFLDGADAARRTARQALAPHLDADVTFGSFNPREDTLSLGDAVTFEIYRMPIESPAVFQYAEVRGYRAGAAHIPVTHLGYDFGWIRIGAEPRRVYASPTDQQVLLVPPGHPASVVDPVDLDDEDSWFVQRIAAGDVERIGPIPPTSTYDRRTYQQLPPRKTDE